MDPLSAVVAFAGLGASLITILGTICNVSMTLLELQKRCKSAPRNILQLHQDLASLRALVEAIHIQFSGDEATGYPAALREICESYTVQLKHDLEELQTISTGFNRKSRFPASKGIKAQTRYLLNESTINEHHRRISMHIGNLTVVQALANSYKVDDLRQNSLEILDATKAILGLMSSQMQYFESNHQQDQTLMALIFKRHASEQNQKKILSIEPYEKSKTYEFGFGLLSLQIFEVCHSESVTKGQKGYRLRLEASFVPPYWISRTALKATVYLSGPSPSNAISPRISLQPMTVNHNPSLLGALYSLDILKVRHLFESNQARPTDMVMDLDLNEPVHLSEALLRMFTYMLPCSMRLTMHMELFSFLVDQGTPLPTEAAIVFLLIIESYWGRDQPQILSGWAQNYCQRLLSDCTISLDTFRIPARLFSPPGWSSPRYGPSEGTSDESIISALAESVLGFDHLKYCLLHNSQPWTLEDLSGRNLWYIAVLVHADQDFRASTAAYVNSFRSNLDPTEENYLNALMDSVLDINDIADQVESASPTERWIFMSTLAGKGTPPMLAPFLKIDIDINEGTIYGNYLGIAAAKRNVEVFRMLLNAGASSVRAIPILCQSLAIDDQTCSEEFSELIGNISPTKGQIRESDFPDPLIAIIKCDRALETQPDAPQLLLRNNILFDTRLHGSKTVYACHSYIFQTICYNRIEILNSLLEHKPPIHLTIMNMFATDREHFKTIADYTFLTLAVELGRSECVTLLLAIGSSPEQAVTCPDGLCRTALQIAQSNVNCSHPRKTVLNGLHRVENQGDTLVPAAKDEATLRIIQAAIGSKFTASPSPAHGKIVTTQNNDLALVNTNFTLIQPLRSSAMLNRIERLRVQAMDVATRLLHISPRGFSSLHAFMACHELECPEKVCRDRHLQASLKTKLTELSRMGFLESLLLRVSYIGMLAMVLLYDLVALVLSFMNIGRVPRPSWVVISLALLVVVWIFGM